MAILSTLEYNELIDFATSIKNGIKNTIPLDASDFVNEAYTINPLASKEEFKILIKNVFFQYKIKFFNEEIYDRGVSDNKKTMREIERICKECNDLYPLALFKIYKTHSSVGDIVGNVCQKCRNRKALEYYHRNKIKILKRRNTAKYKLKKRQYYFNNRERLLSFHRVVTRKSYKKQRELLADSYIKQLLRVEGYKNEQITDLIIIERRNKVVKNREKRNKKLNDYRDD